MASPAITPTKFGWRKIAEPFRADRLYLHDGVSPLREADHEPPVPVLDQEDLFAQGIDTSALVPGARKVDALGSCTCNAGTVHLAERVAAAEGTALVNGLTLGNSAGQVHVSTTDPVASERFAIVAYDLVTHQTGDPSQEWPPTDCGSNGYYVCTEFERNGTIGSFKSASGVTNVVSLLQAGSVMMGAPWFNSWMEPDSLGFVDGGGTYDDFQYAMSSGVAGGHETCITAIERLVIGPEGYIRPEMSHARVRNSWSTSFGDNGSYRLHLSTLRYLGANADFKQMVVTAA
jgi:hypothetical protein